MTWKSCLPFSSVSGLTERGKLGMGTHEGLAKTSRHQDFHHLFPVFFPSPEACSRRSLLRCHLSCLLANFSLEDSEKAVWTENKGLVLLVRDFIIHEIYIVKIREAFPGEIVKAFGANWEKIRLPAASSLTGTRS